MLESDAEIAIYKSMRQQALGKNAGEIDDGDIALVLFGCGLRKSLPRPTDSRDPRWLRQP